MLHYTFKKIMLYFFIFVILLMATHIQAVDSELSFETVNISEDSWQLDRDSSFTSTAGNYQSRKLPSLSVYMKQFGLEQIKRTLLDVLFTGDQWLIINHLIPKVIDSHTPNGYLEIRNFTIHRLTKPKKSLIVLKQDKLFVDIEDVGVEFEFEFYMRPNNERLKRFYSEAITAKISVKCDSMSFKAGIEPTIGDVHKKLSSQRMPTITIHDPVLKIHTPLKIDVKDNRVGSMAASLFNFIDKWLGQYLRPLLESMAADGLQKVETVVPKLLFYNIRNLARSVDHEFLQATGKDLNSMENIKLDGSFMDIMPGQLFIAAHLAVKTDNIF